MTVMWPVAAALVLSLSLLAALFPAETEPAGNMCRIGFWTPRDYLNDVFRA
ncbi:MAG: hypothetical protein HYV62_05170 [Candidatus Rokubacteria bacterium]|nr:hypothetical protein [Candidatus Rokubacteria bacterium]